MLHPAKKKEQNDGEIDHHVGEVEDGKVKAAVPMDIIDHRSVEEAIRQIARRRSGKKSQDQRMASDPPFAEEENKQPRDQEQLKPLEPRP